ncbi:NADH-ubiquinone oxidoreductase 21.3 kDa subunit [Sodiomyces alkalinus F11]|uniref:NADH-ubiquinone oxidoreductase 21.3 kDa subunit n=1 Tax=Sodiomyces alkalinus (strain CBS 110278 / VKM F-3762 / F11) TaxID=1314773 RepID=A0A3N2Q482_SODAK|nr:NADH-ubiquinone oxidoreductase 21.3 kDa subunit [Sodiomyces alkalinus F11]ROT41517.1 NADH-ubiquinone oxidoreductase 21.3 kDa subunit [Sodiomyces alkalinus F11]
MEISKKHTLQSTGIYERIRRALAIDPNRSSGVPLNATFRNPTPGALDPLTYDDPVTIPAGDIADNAYFRRDTRRAYPKLSVVSQSDVVSLLTVGSAANPKVELIGEAGEQALVEARAEGEKKGGLAAFLENKGKAIEEVSKDVFVNGLPPTPAGERIQADGSWHVYKFKPNEDQAYGDGYPCRTFS